MKPKLSIAAALLLALFVSGCASRITSSGGKETALLGGALTIAENSFQPISASTLDTNVSNMTGKNGPSGTKVSVLWGMFTFHDY